MTLRSVKLLIIFTILTSLAPPVLAAKKNLKIEVKTSKDLPIKKSLSDLAADIEKLSKIYHTSDQGYYWSSEGKKSFTKLLNAEGFYASTIDVELANNMNSIIFHINHGPRYTIKDVAIKHAKDSNSNINIQTLKDLNIKSGQLAIAQNIIHTQDELLSYIEKNNCLLSLEVTHNATINHIDNTVSILFIVKAGPTATIEDISFTGLNEVKPKYIRKLMKLENGQCFRRSEIEQARGALQKSGLFSSTTPIIPQNTNKDGSVPVEFNLKERKPRSLTAGALYGTDLGIGAKFGWEHRNFYGNGERVKTSLSGNKKEQTFDANYIHPFYKRDDQTLKLNFAIENQRSKAFNSREESAGGVIERQLSDQWMGGTGGAFSYAKVKAKDTTKNKYSALFSVPLFITHDTRNDILNPRKGHVLNASIDTFFSLNKEEQPFCKIQLSASKYFLLSQTSRPVLALRGAVGSIQGGKLAKIPHTERFFVGGNHSVRGYAPQFAGNISENNVPTGGRSFLETTIELRLPITSTIGMVGFLDSGYAYTNSMPGNERKILHGAGFGLRYITDFGPIRADIAFPLKRRKSIDKSYQFSFGIGQSF